MSLVRVSLFFLVIVVIPAWSKQPLPPQQTQTATQSSATKDPQAVSIATQAVNVAGGSPAIMAIDDFTASGSVTYSSGLDSGVPHDVTIRGRGLGQLRIDTNFPSGKRSESTNGQTIVKSEDGSTVNLKSQAPLYPVRLALPALQLRAALISSGFSLQYVGMVQLDGNSAYEIQAQRILQGWADPNTQVNRYLSFNYFIDVSTSRILMMQDSMGKGLVRQIRYSDFRVVNSLLIPFSISETIDGQPIRVIHLSQVGFNSGLQDSDFQL